MALKKTSALSLLLVVTLALSAPSAFSQVVDSTEAEMEGATMQPVDSQVAGQSIDQVNYANVVAAVENSNAAITKLGTLTDLTADRIHIINVETLTPPAGSTADLDQKLAATASQRGQIQTVIDDTDVLEEALDSKNVDHDAVIAFDVLQDGSVVVFYH